MKLRRNETCPIHRSLFCCGREQMRKPTRLQAGVRLLKRFVSKQDFFKKKLVLPAVPEIVLVQ